MILNTTSLIGKKLAATDGEIGHIKDFFFDDNNWTIRYLVVNTGSWLSSRLVLLAPHSFGAIDPDTGVLAINLRMKQIEDSPPIDTHKPVSRQYEIDYYRYYGWPVYWDGGGMAGLRGYPMEDSLSKVRIDRQLHLHHGEDRHLRSLRAIAGYMIEATDGPIGAVSGLMVDDRSWVINDLVVDAGHWLPVKDVFVATRNVDRIAYEESAVFVSLTKEDIKRTAENEVVHAGPHRG